MRLLSVYLEEGDVTNEDIPMFPQGLQLVSGEGNGYPLQYSCLEDFTDRGACWAAVRGVAERRTRLSDGACAVSKLGSWGPP